jgi:hypothetical protein
LRQKARPCLFLQGWRSMVALDDTPTAYGGYSSLSQLAHQSSTFGILWESCSGNTCLAFAKLTLANPK